MFQRGSLIAGGSKNEGNCLLLLEKSIWVIASENLAPFLSIKPFDSTNQALLKTKKNNT